jgi:uncharacterized membrane protein
VIRLIAMEATIIALAAGMAAFVAMGLFAPRVLALWTGYANYGSLWGAWIAHECLAVLVVVAAALLAATSAWRLRHTNISRGLKEGGASAG